MKYKTDMVPPPHDLLIISLNSMLSVVLALIKCRTRRQSPNCARFKVCVTAIPAFFCLYD